MKHSKQILKLAFLVFSMAAILFTCQSEEKTKKGSTAAVSVQSTNGFAASDSIQVRNDAPIRTIVEQPPAPEYEPLTSREIEALLKKILQDLSAARSGPGSLLPFEISIYGGKIVAMYVPGNDKDTVFFGKRAFDILYQHFGDHWTKAAAVILGHEFGHDLDGVNSTVDFLQGEENYASSSLSEEIADINGVFLCYLAGYDPRSIYTDVLKVMYESFDIPPDGMDNKYPPLEQRIKAAQKAMDKVNLLVQLFDSGNLLSAAGEYEWAFHCFDQIAQNYYLGREIYFNQGINALLAALDGQYKLDPFVWPVEQDWQTRLQAQEEIPKALYSGAEKQRSMWLLKAEKAFQEARKVDPAYHKAALYELVVLALRDDTGVLLHFYDTYQFKEKQVPEELLDKANLAIALHYLNNFEPGSKESEKAKQILRELTGSSSEYTRLLAKANLDIMEGKFSFDPSIQEIIPVPLQKILDQPLPKEFRVSQQWDITSTFLKEIASMKLGVDDASEIVRIKSEKSAIQIHRYKLNEKQNYDISKFLEKTSPFSIVPISEGKLIVLKGKGGIFLVKDRNVVKEVIKIYNQ